MEIRNKMELKFCMMADRMMNRGRFKKSYKDYIRNLFEPDDIMKYLVTLRKLSYYRIGGGTFNKLMYAYYHRRYVILGERLGFSIGLHSLGYGVVIPHPGTIVIGGAPRIGNFAVLHTSTCITNNKKVIGDGLYLSAGVKITSEITLGNNISIGANSLVNKTFTSNNAMIAGMPAHFIKELKAWYIDDEKYMWRHEQVETLKIKMDIQ